MKSHEEVITVDCESSWCRCNRCIYCSHCYYRLSTLLLPKSNCCAFEVLTEVFQFPQVGHFCLSLNWKVSLVWLVHDTWGILVLPLVGRERQWQWGTSGIPAVSNVMETYSERIGAQWLVSFLTCGKLNYSHLLFTFWIRKKKKEILLIWWILFDIFSYQHEALKCYESQHFTWFAQYRRCIWIIQTQAWIWFWNSKAFKKRGFRSIRFPRWTLSGLHLTE